MTPCILWEGALTTKGYSSMRHPETGVTVYGHRHFYEKEHGAIPEDMTIDHLCETKACINVEHMEVVTAVENHRRHYANLTHCLKGVHEWTEENTITSKEGWRRCRACRDEYMYEYNRRL